MTGTATGPHLDYRISKNGVYLNPLAELSKMPPGEPIPASELEAFGRARDTVMAELRALVADATAAPATPQTVVAASSDVAAVSLPCSAACSVCRLLKSRPFRTTSSTPTRRALASGHPLSFLHVTRAEIDLRARDESLRRVGLRPSRPQFEELKRAARAGD